MCNIEDRAAATTLVLMRLGFEAVRSVAIRIYPVVTEPLPVLIHTRVHGGVCVIAVRLQPVGVVYVLRSAGVVTVVVPIVGLVRLG